MCEFVPAQLIKNYSSSDSCSFRCRRHSGGASAALGIVSLFPNLLGSRWPPVPLGLNQIYSFIVIISSTNKYRKHKSNMLIWVLPIDKKNHDNYTDIYDGKMANCCQKVRGNKIKQRPKTTTKTNKQNKTPSKTTVPFRGELGVRQSLIKTNINMRRN